MKIQQIFQSGTQDAHSNHLKLIEADCQYIVEGMNISAPAGVYHPHEQSSSLLLLSVLFDLQITHKNVIEIGSGSGVISLWMAKNGNQVVATDIQEASCAATRQNALSNGILLESVRQGDMWDAVEAHESFDIAICNLPLKDKQVDEPGEKQLCDPGGILLSKFLTGLAEHLKPSGMAIFTWANFSSPIPSRWKSAVKILKSKHYDENTIFNVCQLLL
ncbi:MAG: methyltransferase [Thiobacillus sp.]